MERLAQLKAQRAAIDDEINLIEAGISKAAYDGSMASQLTHVNEARAREGKPPKTMSAWQAGVEEDDDRDGGGCG